MSTRRIVVVGGGGSGIPIAARLGAAGHDVIVLEAGPAAPAEPAWTVRGGVPDSLLTRTYDAELWPGRPWRIARGRTLGGSTAVNGASFQRPHPDDFAAWAALAGSEWTYTACLPALRRLEADQDFPDDPVHGDSGPMPVSRDGADEPLTRAFLAASVAAGATAEPDKNGGGPSGAGPLPRNVSTGGEPQRWSVARGYGRMLRAASVEVRTGVEVHRVRFRGRTAIGVETVVDGTPGFVAADEVILAGGAVETPRLLLRSGIGDASDRDPTAPPIADRRGVGRNLSDHAAIDLPWRPRPGAASATAAWTAAWNVPAGFAASSALELLFATLPTAVIVTGDRAAGGPHELRVLLGQPIARGRVGIGPGPAVCYGYLTDGRDIRALRDGVRLAAQVLRSPEMAEVVADATIPAWVDAAADPGAEDAERWLRDRLATALHSCGTARMGAAADPDAVADAHGRVHGTTGLRIADASLVPVVPTRGTALLAVMLGERIAELIAQE